MTILVDADACPVKDQIYAAAYRHKTPVPSMPRATCAIPTIR
jgi:uncharacterized protein YaiI (UPF0178 family)